MMRAMKQRKGSQMLEQAKKDVAEVEATPFAANEAPPELVLADWVFVHQDILPKGWQDMNVTVEEAAALLKNIALCTCEKLILPSGKMIGVATYFNQAGT